MIYQKKQMTIYNHSSYQSQNLKTQNLKPTPDLDSTLDEGSSDLFNTTERTRKIFHLHHLHSDPTPVEHVRTTLPPTTPETFSHNSFGRVYEFATPLTNQNTEDLRKINLLDSTLLDTSLTDASLTAETCKTPIASTLKTPQTVTPQSGFTILHTQSPIEHRKLCSITNTWAETARARYLHTRDCLTPQKKATKDDTDYDHTQMQDYIEIIRYFQSKGNYGEASHFLALIDQTQNVQGVAKLTKKTDHLYLNALLTAAWNLPQTGETPTKIKKAIPQVKGGGTALVAASCELARDLKLTRLETSPSAGAKPFYTKTLQMPYNEESQTCVLDVTQPLPERLKAMQQFPITKIPTYEIPPSPFDDFDD